MSTDASRQNEMKRVLKQIINALEDSQKGFAELGEHLKDETLKRHFLGESLKRANFRGELENELHRAGVHDVHESGTAAGTVLRMWGELKARFGAGDHALLETAEQAEDTTRDVYDEALKDENLPLPLRQVLAEQQAQVLEMHAYIRMHRDAVPTR